MALRISRTATVWIGIALACWLTAQIIVAAAAVSARMNDDRCAAADRPVCAVETR